MQTGITIFTILLVVAFVILIIFSFFKEKKSLSKYTLNLIFNKYNKKLEKIDKLFQNEKLSQLLCDCKMKVVEKGKLSESYIFDNIKTIDSLEDNWTLLKNIQKEIAHQGSVADRISLLKKQIEIVNMENYVATPKTIKHKALMFFNEKFREVKLDKHVKTILSGTPCYKFGDNFMFLEDKVLKIDMENVFAVEILNYDDLNIKVWKKGEEWIDFDRTYDIEETTHRLPKSREEDFAPKEQVLSKIYVLSFTNGTMTYDIEHREVIKELQEKYEKLTENKELKKD